MNVKHVVLESAVRWLAGNDLMDFITDLVKAINDDTTTC